MKQLENSFLAINGNVIKLRNWSKKDKVLDMDDFVIDGLITACFDDTEIDERTYY